MGESTRLLVSILGARLGGATKIVVSLLSMLVLRSTERKSVLKEGTDTRYIVFEI